MTSKKYRKIKLISLNMLGVPLVPTRMSSRFRVIAREFERMGPDIIALQEVYTGRQLNRIIQFLPSYPYVVYVPYVSGPKGGLVVFSKIPVESYAFIPLTKRGAVRKKLVLSRVLRKGVLVIKFQDLPIVLLNTQLYGNLDSDWAPENRFMPIIRKQLTEIKDIVREYQHIEENIILTGDFNIPKDSPIYRVFLKDTKLKDAFSKFVDPTLHMWFFKGWKSLERLDFVFYYGNSIVVSDQSDIFTEKYRVNRYSEGYLSDHIGLSLTIKIL